MSANPNYGFSIVSYSGSGSSGTIGHGLNAVPKLIIVKPRTGTTTFGWRVYSSATGNANHLRLDTDTGSSAYSDWNSTNPTSSVFSVDGSPAGTVNASGGTYIAYCWSEVSGFSKFGSYSGGTNPKTITTGFKPAFLLIKRSDGSNQWIIIDSKRGGTKKLAPNLTVTENDGTYLGGDSSNTVEFLADGFKLTTTNAETNGSGQTHIYAAFAGVPSGEEDDSLLDTPTNYDDGTNVGGNYCTLNPLTATSDFTASDGNLKGSESVNTGGCLGTMAFPSTGKWYFEVVFDSVPGYNHVGIATAESDCITNNANPGYDTTNEFTYWQNGSKTNNVAYGDSFAANDVIGVAFDAGAGSLVFYKNGVSQGVNATGLLGTYFPFIPGYYDYTCVVNFGQRAFAYPVSGYKSLCTTNLPDPTIADGLTAFNASIWNGNSTQDRKISTAFSPGLVWVKRRNASKGHVLIDKIRGDDNYMFSNLSDKNEVMANLLGLVSDGYELGTVESVNATNNTYVGWAWNAGTSTVSNTDGSITSNVRASQTNGISIVSYTGTGTSATVGHSLNAAPAIYIIKSRGSVTDWQVSTTVIDGSHDYLQLNTTGAKQNSGRAAPTSSVFSVGSGTVLNASGVGYIAYCFAPVEGLVHLARMKVTERMLVRLFTQDLSLAG